MLRPAIAVSLFIAGAFAQPVCNAVSTGLITDGQGITRATGYTCPTNIGVGEPIGKFIQREFYLIVEHPPLDNPTLTFSRTLPMVKFTGSSDPVSADDLKPGTWYRVVYRGNDHQIYPNIWYVRGPLGHAMQVWSCCPITADTGEVFTLNVARFQLADGTFNGPFYVIQPAPAINPTPPKWTRIQ